MGRLVFDTVTRWPVVIQLQREPVGSRDILHAALAKRCHGARQLRSLRGSPKTGAPLPVYRISHPGALKPNPLRRAKKIGWGFPIVGGEIPGIGCLVIKGNTLKYAGVVEGHTAEKLWNAASLADRRMRSLKRKVEARILQIPTLRIRALWFHSHKQKSVFVLVRGGRARLRVIENIQPIIDDALTHVRSAGTTRKASHAPS